MSCPLGSEKPEGFGINNANAALFKNESGEAVPTMRLRVTLPLDLHSKVGAYCALTGMTASGFVASIIAPLPDPRVALDAAPSKFQALVEELNKLKAESSR